MSNPIELLEVVKAVHAEHADDVCWMDIDRIFKAAGLPVPDRRVGDKLKMAGNCIRFIDTMCQGGKWVSYAALENERNILRELLNSLASKISDRFVPCKYIIDTKTMRVGRYIERFELDLFVVGYIVENLHGEIERWLGANVVCLGGAYDAAWAMERKHGSIP